MGDMKKASTPARNSRRIVLNISGGIYETRISTLRRFPKTLLGNRRKRSIFYCATSGQYFFPRSRVLFDYILYFYQSQGVLQCPPGIDLESFEDECRFFEMPEHAIQRLKPPSLNKLLGLDEEDAHVEVLQGSAIKRRVWNALQHPETSRAAKYFAIFSLFMISLSVASSCLETVPYLKVETNILEDNYWAITELHLNLWFLIELTVGAVCAPSIRNFLTSAMTWVDIIAIVPYFGILILSKDEASSLGFLRIIRLIRVARLFRLSKHSIRLKIVGSVLKSSISEFGTILMCLIMVVILGGSLIYHIEGGVSDSHFTDIPTSVYWGIQTITTLGYGDIHPQTISGMLFAAMFMMFGAMTISIPVLSIVCKFESAYRNVFSNDRK